MKNQGTGVLGATGKRILLTVHIILNSIWIGGLAAVLFLSLIKSSVGEPHRAAIDHAIFVLHDSIVMNVGFGVIVTAVLFSLFTKWNFFDFYWIILKWVGLVIIFFLVTFCLAPAINGGAAISDILGETAALNRDYISYESVTILTSAMLLITLAAITALSVFKPWGPRKKPFGTKRRTVLTAGILAGSLAVSAGALQFFQLRAYRAIEVRRVDVSEMEDGRYSGMADLGVTYRVEAHVKSGRLMEVRILDEDPGHYLHLASAIAQRFIGEQGPNVRVITGATTSSKGLMLALQNALENGNRVR